MAAPPSYRSSHATATFQPLFASATQDFECKRMPARPFSSSPPPAAPRRYGRVLAALTVAVLLAHGLALRGAALRIGTAPEEPAPPPVFEARTVTPPSPPAAAAAPDVPKNEANRPVAQANRALAAPKIIAKPETAPTQAPTPEPAIETAAPPPLPTQQAAAPPSEPSSPPVTPALPETAVAAAAAAAQAAAPPPPPALTGMALPGSIQLAYQMTGSARGLNYSASARLDWLNSGSAYETTMTVSAFLLGSRSMESRGEIGPYGLAPVRFADKRSKRELAAHFEPARQQIIFSNNSPVAPWFPGAQDRLSVFLQLAGMLGGNPGAYPLGTTIAVYTAGAGGADTLSFKVEAEELLALPAGEMATLKLASLIRNDYDRKFEIWYAPSLQYLPVRVKYTQANGDFIDQQLKEVRRP
jgi:hypothetical protein